MKSVSLYLLLFCLCYESSAKTKQITRYGDRVFVRDVLLSVFGSAAKKEVEKYVFNQPHVFGGACDPYSQTLIKEGTHYKTMGGSERCNDNFFAEYRAPVIAENSPLRSAAIQKVCKASIEIPKAVDHALTKARVDSQGPIKKEDVIKVFRLFYPVGYENLWRRIDQSLSNSSQKSKREWKFYLKLFCQSEEWQVL